MKKRSTWLTLAAAAVMVLGLQRADAETILYVPQDDRPVSLLYTVDTAEWAGYTVITPPKEYISGRNFHGDADAIWRWVDANAGKADAMVLSTDTLVYGGLVDSRKHNYPLSVLEKRVAAIKMLKKKYPNVPIYGFGTVMRSPRASGGGVEPSYYSVYGPDIFRIAALQDKLDEGALTTQEGVELVRLQAQVPLEYLQDWFDRREKNMTINRELIDEVRSGVFSYFALGHDDTSALSQSAMEGRYLKKYSKGLSLNKYGSFPGADQLGLLLIARYHVDHLHLHPTFETLYPLGGAGETVPHYEDQTIAKTIQEHIEAVGGSSITHGKPDYLLAVNTPLTTTTGESEAFANLPLISPSVNAFLDKIQTAIREGVPVSIADIAYSNGSDNMLMAGLRKRDLLYKVDAYNGWNTASNTVGYAIAQAILGKAMSAQGHRDMLTQQYLDNWGYQANVRKDIYRMQDAVKTGNVRYSDPLKEALTPAMNEEIQDFAEKYLGINPRTVEATFPWGRLFETEIHVYDQPIAPLQREIRLQQEEQERQRKAAEEAAKLAAQQAAEKAGANAKASEQPATAGTQR